MKGKNLGRLWKICDIIIEIRESLIPKYISPPPPHLDLFAWTSFWSFWVRLETVKRALAIMQYVVMSLFVCSIIPKDITSPCQAGILDQSVKVYWRGRDSLGPKYFRGRNMLKCIGAKSNFFFSGSQNFSSGIYPLPPWLRAWFSSANHTGSVSSLNINVSSMCTIFKRKKRTDALSFPWNHANGSAFLPSTETDQAVIDFKTTLNKGVGIAP